MSSSELACDEIMEIQDETNNNDETNRYGYYGKNEIILDDQLLPDNFMTVSTEIATLPQSTKSRNSDFLVSCGTNSHRDFGLI